MEPAQALRHGAKGSPSGAGAPARFVLVCTPAGFERYFARMEAEEAGVEPPEWALQGWPEVTNVGPRIGE